jgi:hypothetical protein
MKIDLKWIVLLETALIALLLVVIASLLKNTSVASNYAYGLISPCSLKYIEISELPHI